MKILVLGAGKMGRGAVHDLSHNSPGVTAITVADTDARTAETVAEMHGGERCQSRRVDVGDFQAVVELMRGHDAAISCVPYFYNAELARAAIQARVNFCDLGGNNDVVARELALNDEAKAAGINIIPDCGLAPGMVSVLAMHGAGRFDTVDSIKIRVGGLPQNPLPPLDYQLVFSVEGLINEYIEPARVIRDGAIATVESLTELETLEFPGFPQLEAFQTSGGTSTLPETLLGQVRELDYKTIRYKGHCDKFKTLTDLGFANSQPITIQTTANDNLQIAPRQLLAELLLEKLPKDEPDIVLIRLDFVGTINEGQKNLRYDLVDRYDAATDLTAMMRATAFPASIVAQMMARGETGEKGAVPQELTIPAQRFVDELARRGIVIRNS